MSDLISRADAIDAVAQQWLFEASVGNPYVNDDDIGEYRKLAEELFEDVPSADALLKQEIDFHEKVSRIEAEKVVDLEHKLADAVQGEWIVREYCTNELDYRRWIEIECPFCGEKPTYENLDNMNFCPNCGARMTPYKGGETE